MGGGKTKIVEGDLSKPPIEKPPLGKPLLEKDFPTDGFMEIAKYNIDNFPSYTDNEGKKALCTWKWKI